MSDSVSGAAAPNVTPAQQSVLTRVEAMVRAVEADLIHDEQAIVAWVKAELAKI